MQWRGERVLASAMTDEFDDIRARWRGVVWKSELVAEDGELPEMRHIIDDAQPLFSAPDDIARLLAAIDERDATNAKLVAELAKLSEWNATHMATIAERDAEIAKLKRGWYSPESAPHMFFQPKGTNLCADFHCSCGASWHLDGDFIYDVQCFQCSKVWEVSTCVRLTEATDPNMDSVATHSASQKHGFYSWSYACGEQVSDSHHACKECGDFYSTNRIPLVKP